VTGVACGPAAFLASDLLSLQPATISAAGRRLQSNLSFS
jgi:hypothetical protein